MNSGERRRLNEIGTEIVRSAIRVHRSFGPGLLESAYQTCLAVELRNLRLRVETEVGLPIVYRDQRIDAGYRIDMLVEDSVIVENKAVERLLSVHTAQILTYLELSGKRIGYLMNWNVPLMKNGIHRFVVGAFAEEGPAGRKNPWHQSGGGLNTRV